MLTQAGGAQPTNLKRLESPGSFPRVSAASRPNMNRSTARRRLHARPATGRTTGNLGSCYFVRRRKSCAALAAGS
ncbi:hypothetical protein GobsT_03550 [Gemmata obscuriglobus]|nr:hypothetical protein GobsT_03550 [Gemmata obscuriglobus]VTR99154.1 unnamed protein product [Gemmata obscuriglobus UQM 2246]